MRINKFVATATGMSRRRADTVITEGRVHLNAVLATPGAAVQTDDIVTLDDKPLKLALEATTVILNKPAGYVVSRAGQGSRTIYELLPAAYHGLKPVGRLDKESSGLLLLTDDGQLANELTHPSHQKVKIYELSLDKPLAPLHQQIINDRGVNLKDGLSQLQLARHHDGDDYRWQVTMREGRNRQIRRTFQSLGYTVTELHRTDFGSYSLSQLNATQRFKKL